MRMHTKYYRFPKVAEWMVNRGTEAESNIITVYDYGDIYRSCNTSNSIGTVANLTCENLLQNEHRLGPTTTVVSHDKLVIIGLANGIGVLGIIDIALAAFFIRKWRRRNILPDINSTSSVSDTS
ncbi:10572_t:CDS:2 [Ambispora gerdemannii]|uniref:10572_t:CDS:1 n=1 Tax=Ambispora gerdemannii TaxID=144530 RepID=A0A9N9FYB0_9GLOM|nr:10572_t:CDS:2 [Ambispora gerdemannii]